MPPLGSSEEGEDRKDSQLAYARTLLAVFNETVSQLAVVVDLEQLHAEKEAASSAGPPMAPANEQTQDKAQAAESHPAGTRSATLMASSSSPLRPWRTRRRIQNCDQASLKEVSKNSGSKDNPDQSAIHKHVQLLMMGNHRASD